MDAVCIVEPGRAAIVDVPEPAFGPYDVMIDIAYVGFCGSDLTSFRGLNPLVSYPRVPGHEIAGTIAATGNAVSDLSIGQAVTIVPYFNCGTCRACRAGRPNACRNNQTMGVQREGAMTRRVVVPASKVLPVDGLALRELALVEPCAVGFHAVRRGRLAAGETVVILGCGMVGLGVLLGARRVGARTIAFDLSEGKLAVARALGADATINAASSDWREQLSRLVPEGPDLVVEAVGASATFLQAIDIAASCGRVVYVGYAKDAIAYDTKQFITKELDILGSRNALPEDFRNVIDYLRANPGAGQHVISRQVPLSQAPEALAAWHERPGDFTKIVVEIGA
jgi:2-desacetyl-2-hydroxyethyl bacteriochlorophyllide A dehydrogenase